MNDSTSGFEHDLERYLARGMGEKEMRAFEDRVLDDPEHAADLYAHINVTEALRLTSEAPDTIRPSTRESGNSRWTRWALPLAAAALVILAVQLLPVPPAGESPTFRGGSSDVTPISPVGDQSSTPEEFVWRRVAGASAYRFELFDAEARVVHRTVLTDTLLIASSLPGDLPVRGSWRLTPLDDLNLDLSEGITSAYRILER